MNAHIVLLGGLNASLHMKELLARDNKLKSFLEEFQITTLVVKTTLQTLCMSMEVENQ